MFASTYVFVAGGDFETSGSALIVPSVETVTLSPSIASVDVADAWTRPATSEFTVIVHRPPASVSRAGTAGVGSPTQLHVLASLTVNAAPDRFVSVTFTTSAAAATMPWPSLVFF